MDIESHGTNPAEHIESKYILYGVVSSFLFFQIVHKIVVSFGSPSAVRESDHWKWKNILISWIHSVICSLWITYCCYTHPSMFDDLITHIDMASFLLATFSTGYFIFDLIDYIQSGQALKDWEVCLHHLVVISIFSYHMAANQCIGYTTFVLMVEYNSIFLHGRKLLKLAKKISIDHWVFRCNSVLNVVTFVIFRFGVVLKVMVGTYNSKTRFPALYYWCLVISVLIMTIINVVLFWRLLK
ncbi:unnamed protein product, partial [Owenia fusiformis]